MENATTGGHRAKGTKISLQPAINPQPLPNKKLNTSILLEQKDRGDRGGGDRGGRALWGTWDLAWFYPV